MQGQDGTELYEQRQDAASESRTGVGISSYLQQTIQTLTVENLTWGPDPGAL